MKPIIKVENLSKQYRLGNVGTGTLSNDLKRWWHKVRGQEDPFLKIGESNDRTTKGGSEYVWALKDINFEVMPGEVLGIIGKNGAGKSTLLKILSKVTGPTTGRIDFNGRIGSLLEVGTGFHPELTGRENIYLNGAILGMTKAEINRKLDEIIDFSGCERYIDTPVKRYSSGMTVRLGFAVAAHLEPEILVVDEVLAVGDAEFQKKAIGKMQDVSNNEGRTVLFVSHNMPAVAKLCTKGIVLFNGKNVFQGDQNESISFYLKNNFSLSNLIVENIEHCHSNILIQNITINNKKTSEIYLTKDESSLEITFEGRILNYSMALAFEVFFYDELETPIAIYNPDFINDEIKTFHIGDFIIKRIISLPPKINKGNYILGIYLTNPLVEFYVKMPKAAQVIFEGWPTSSGFIYEKKDAGFINLS